MKSKQPKIHIVATSVTGLYHQSQRTSCQDAFKYAKRGQKFVAVVADGAGSARFSKIGARIVCETLCDLLLSSPLKNMQQAIINAIEVARQKLILHRYNKTKNTDGLLEFAATLVGVVGDRTGGLFFHIGDGAALALGAKTKENIIISRPENGIFACETYFYTMDDWKDSLRFTPFQKAQSLMLMTDGVTGFAFKNDYEALERGFVEPINSYLMQEESLSRALRALNNTLSNPRACRLNPDDKTLLWAGWR